MYMYTAIDKKYFHRIIMMYSHQHDKVITKKYVCVG